MRLYLISLILVQTPQFDKSDFTFNFVAFNFTNMRFFLVSKSGIFFPAELHKETVFCADNSPFTRYVQKTVNSQVRHTFSHCDQTKKYEMIEIVFIDSQ